MRSAAGTKSPPPSAVTPATKSTIACFAAPSFHDAKGSGALWMNAIGHSPVRRPLIRLAELIEFEVFRRPLLTALTRSDGSRGGRPPYDPVLMFKILVLQMGARDRRKE